MSNFKIECPHCAQHLACDLSYSRAKIQCPGCQKEMIIPDLSAADPVSPAPLLASIPVAPRIVARRPVAPPPPTPAPSRPAHAAAAGAAGLPAAREPAATASRSKRALTTVLVVLLAAPALYFGFQWVTRTQKKINEARAKDDDPGLIGGQVSHLIELNQVLDATDPARMGSLPDTEAGRAMARATKARSAAVGGASGASDADNLPVKPAAWTLDLTGVSIPASKVCGVIGGSNFVANSTMLLTGTARPVLALSQGESLVAPDLGLLVSVRLKPGESLENRTWTISPEDTTNVPQVTKRWRSAATRALTQRAFNAGYAMKLEFGKISEGVAPGKIYLALPDAEHSTVSGHFQAQIRVSSPNRGATSQPNERMDEGY